MITSVFRPPGPFSIFAGLLSSSTGSPFEKNEKTTNQPTNLYHCRYEFEVSREKKNQQRGRSDNDHAEKKETVFRF
jgi:hypothetical protein